MPDKIRLTNDELFSAEVDMRLDEQHALQQAMPGFNRLPLWRRIMFNSMFFLSVAGLIGGIIGWRIIEPHMYDNLSIWGRAESMELSTYSRQQGIVLTVNGTQALAHAKITRVKGIGEYARITNLDDLAEGMPMEVRGMVHPSGEAVFIATRITVRNIPPEHTADPWLDVEKTQEEGFLISIFAFAIIGTCVAGMVAAADGVMSRNIIRGLLCGACGIGIAAVGGIVGILPSSMVLGLFQALTDAAAGGEMWTSDTLTGFPLLLFIIGRSLTWGVLGMTVGLGQGVALRSKKLALNGFLGGMLGGLLGGMFFEPWIKIAASTGIESEAAVSRAFGFAVIGLSTGLMIGLVEHFSKNAWLLMKAGPLAGKQFVIYRNPTTLGSSPKCEVYLFKDPDVEPRHALIRKTGARSEIQDLKTPIGTFVNGRRVNSQMLIDGDQITIGKTVLEYSERASSG